MEKLREVKKREKSGDYLRFDSMRGEILALAKEFDLRDDSFPDEVAKEAEVCAAETGVDASSQREDLRNLPLVTIDGPNAKDFDDAVFCRSTADGYELVVAIADVSAYVRASGAVDKEAGSRCTSVYFPGHVLPMLPPVLSEQVCSLKPDQDRLCLACRMLFAPDGQITDYGFSKAIMCSQSRLTYSKAVQMLENPADDPIHKSLLLLAELSAKLEKRRLNSGALKLSLPTPELVFSEGRVTGISEFVPLRTHGIIEECMLVANVCAAKFLNARQRGFLYRVHAKPEQLRIEQLRLLLGEYGIKVGDLEDVRNMQSVIDAVMKLPSDRAHALTFHVLRTLSRAVYTPNRASHYGLGFEDYTHFTSPIRRYPDLLVHRQISAVLAGDANGNIGVAQLAEIGERCSLREQNAEKAERNIVGRMIARLQEGSMGQPQEGIITGITRFGMFVMFSAFAEGLLPLSQLRDDYYELKDQETVLVGKKTKRMFRVGMSLKVAVDSIDMKAGRCRLRLA